MTDRAAPVVLRRRGLRVAAGILLVAVTAYEVWTLASQDSVAAADRVTSAEWWFPVAMLVLLGGLYRYSTCGLVLDGDRATVDNPVVRVRVPYGAVVDVRTDQHLVIGTTSGPVRVWGVEAANLDLLRGEAGRPGGTAADLRALVDAAERDDGAVSRGLRPPDLLLAVCALVLVVCTAVTLTL